MGEIFPNNKTQRKLDNSELRKEIQKRYLNQQPRIHIWKMNSFQGEKKVVMKKNVPDISRRIETSMEVCERNGPTILTKMKRKKNKFKKK